MINLLKILKFHRWRLWGIVIFTSIILFFINITLSYLITTRGIDDNSLVESNWQYKIESNYEGILEKVEESKSNNWLSLKSTLNGAPKGITNIIYYRTNLSVTNVADPHLLLQTNDQAFEVYVDKKLIYDFGNFNDFDYKHSPGAPTHLIPLPNDYQNKELIIVMKSISSKRVGLIRAIELNSKGNLFVKLFKMNIGTLILGCLNIVIGIACMLIGIVRRLGRKAMSSLGLLFITVGIWSISENSLTQLFHLRPVFWFYVAVISIYLIPVCTYKFIMDISNTNRKILTLLIHIHISLLLISFLLNWTGILAFINSMIFFYILTGISYILCIAVSIHSYLKGNTMAFIYTVGQIVLGVFGVYDVLGWYFRIVPWTVNMSPWGMFAFQIALLYAMIVYLKDTQIKFVQYNEEIRKKEKQINHAMEYDKIKTEF